MLFVVCLSFSYYWQTMRSWFVSLIRDSKEISLEMFAELQEQLQDSRPLWVDDLHLFAEVPALKAAAGAAEAAAAAAPANDRKGSGSLKAMRDRDLFAKAYLDPEVN